MSRDKLKPVRTTFQRVPNSEADFSLFTTHLRSGSHFVAVCKTSSVLSMNGLSKKYPSYLHEITHSLDDAYQLLESASQRARDLELATGFGALIVPEPRLGVTNHVLASTYGSVVLRAHYWDNESDHMEGYTIADTEGTVEFHARPTYPSEYSISPLGNSMNPYVTIAAGGRLPRHQIARS